MGRAPLSAGGPADDRVPLKGSGAISDTKVMDIGGSTDPTRPARRGRGIGVRLVMLAVVAVPLLSFCVLALGAVRDVNRQVDASERARTAGTALTGATEVQAAVTVEHYWAGADAAVRDLGLDPAGLTDVIGVDIDAEWARAAVTTDATLARSPVDGVAADVAAARADGDSGPDGGYADAEAAVDARVQALTTELERVALAVDDPEATMATAMVLSETIRLRAQVYGMIASLFGSRYPAQAVTAQPAAELIAARARYREAWKAVEADAPAAPALGQLLDEIAADPRNQSFLATVDAEIARITAGAAPAAPDLSGTADAFTDSMAVLDGYGRAVVAGEAELSARGDELATRAVADRRTEIVAMALVAGATMVIALVIGRWVVRSLDGISASAGAMNDGDLDQPAPVRGPAEVRVAAEALNGAAANIRSAERQVLALAGGTAEPGDLEPVPGPLGASLNVAFERLAASLQDRERLRNELHQEATHDSLTGLPNRAAIMASLVESVGRATRAGGRLAVLFIDIDGFKSINDQYGHGVGDEVLQVIARRVRHAARAEDVVGRLGGDELILVAEAVTDAGHVTGLAQRIMTTVATPIVGATTVTPTLSIGVALDVGADTTPRQLLHDADLAVYEAKAAGGNVIRVCTPELRAASTRREELETALTEAIATDGLSVAYQAIVRAGRREVVGVEALVRWPDRDGSVRAPGEFVPVAERSNLVVSLDRWVAERAVQQLAAWSADPQLRTLVVSVNVSARHASGTPFARDLLALLDRHQVDPRRLAVELTESALIANLDHVVAELGRLRERGITVAIDDFGTGYTSLALLHQLPIDVLKLDRALVTDLGDPRRRQVVKLIVDTAHVIGLSVTAEGVETDAQADELRALGVDSLQGYLFHRPTGAALDAGVLGAVGAAARWPADGGAMADATPS